MPKFEPCPFCGSKDIGYAQGNCYWVAEDFRGNIRAVGCKKCGAIAEIFNVFALGKDEAEERAINSWNRRANNEREQDQGRELLPSSRVDD